MDSLDRLPGDQRAVLQLVLGRRRGYGEIAGTLSIAPEQVRDRAHAALDGLGPPTAVPDAERGRIADYLLGQLSPDAAAAARDSLIASPSQRAWARAVADELRPLAKEQLPEIGDAGAASDQPAADAPAAATPAAAAPAAAAPDADADAAPRSSRTGGIVLLSLVAAAAIAAIVIFVVKPGGGTHHADAPGDGPRASATADSPSSGSSSHTTTSSQSARIVGQVKLAPPAGGTNTTGAALVLAQGTLKGLGIEAVHVPPNTTRPHTAYAVWLYNSPSDATRLGYVNPPVSKNGKLDASARLPANASHYKLLIITLQTESGGHASPKPGPVVLEGKLSDVPRSRL